MTALDAAGVGNSPTGIGTHRLVSNVSKGDPKTNPRASTPTTSPDMYAKKVFPITLDTPDTGGGDSH